MLLRDGRRPIVAYVGRLDTQKGLHLIRHALFYALEHDAQFVLLGSGSEHGINEDFWHLKRLLNDNPDCHLEIGYDEELAHLIYAGADLLVMPSLYEPCGLTQMIALRYGDACRSCGPSAVSRTRCSTGTTPSCRDGSAMASSSSTRTPRGSTPRCDRALDLWRNEPALFRELVLQGMACDFSWHRPGQRYLDVYEFIRHR